MLKAVVTIVSFRVVDAFVTRGRREAVLVIRV
jgi:hypothetical protein